MLGLRLDSGGDAGELASRPATPGNSYTEVTITNAGITDAVYGQLAVEGR